MEAGSTLISGLKTVFGALIPPLKKKYFDQPKIHFIFTFSRASSSKGDLVSNSQATYNYNKHWQYKLILRNNSEYPAYNLSLINPPIGDEFSLIPTLDKLKPVLSNSEISYTAKFHQLYQLNDNSGNIESKKIPELLQFGKFTLEYTNTSGTKFTTIYDCSETTEDKTHQFKVSNPAPQRIILSLVILVIVASISIVSWTILGNKKVENRVEINIKQDANSVAQTINITGWEETGDYVGYLSQITGFYSRHKEQFPIEYEQYKKQLDNWTNFLNKKRDTGKYLYSTDIEGLKGLVNSGDRHLEQLAK